MIYKIGNLADMKALPEMNNNIFLVIHSYASVLTKVYGADRNIDLDDGGYILYIERYSKETELKEYFDYTQHTIEYFDILDDNYVSVTYLLNNEFAVTIVIATDDLPKEIEKELELC